MNSPANEIVLSVNATKFINHYEPLLNKPYQVVLLPDDYPNFACVSEHSDRYLLGLRTNVGNDIIEANYCHELYHLYQLSAGFPTAEGSTPDTLKFCENLRSTILDLSTNDALKEAGISYSPIVSLRYRQMKRLCDTSFREISNQFAKDLLTIDMILDLSDFTNVQRQRILCCVEESLPDVYSKYQEYCNVIYDKFDYHTPEGCLHIFAYVFDDIGLWKYASILYKGNKFMFRPRYERFIQSIGSE